jgi:hypothetical protein
MTIFAPKTSLAIEVFPFEYRVKAGPEVGVG